MLFIAVLWEALSRPGWTSVRLPILFSHTALFLCTFVYEAVATRNGLETFFYFEKQTLPERGAFVFCNLSRILSWAIMYLGCTLPHTSSDSFVRSNWFPTNTILHVGRILAVAPFDFAQGKPQVTSKIHPLLDALASRLERHCSHPWDHPGGRYLLNHCLRNDRTRSSQSEDVERYRSASLLLDTHVSGLSSGASAPATAYCRALLSHAGINTQVLC